MSELTTEQLIKIIIGVFVFVVVVVGVFLFFRFKVIDFFKGYTDEEPTGGEQTGTQGGTPQLKVPTEILKKVQKLCGYCNKMQLFRESAICTEERCNKISNTLNLKCQFVKQLGGRCTAISIGVSYEGRVIPPKLCEDCASDGVCRDWECNNLNKELKISNLKCTYIDGGPLDLKSQCITSQL